MSLTFHTQESVRLRSAHRPTSDSSMIAPPSTPSMQLPLQRKAGHCACGGTCPRCQTTTGGLRLSEPGDPDEQEADRVAAQVLTMPESALGGLRHEPLAIPMRATPDQIQRQPNEAPAEQEEPTLQRPRGDFDLRLDWFEMTRPFYTRGAENLLFFDDRMYSSIGNVWTNNFRFFFNFGLGDKLSADAPNFFTPFTIDSALKRDYATASELFERNADITSLIISPTLFNFDIHDIPGTLRLPFLSILGVEQPNPYARTSGRRTAATRK